MTPSPALLRGNAIRLQQPTVGCFNVSKIQVFSSLSDFQLCTIAPNATATSSSAGTGTPPTPATNVLSVYNGSTQPLTNIFHSSCLDAAWVELTFPSDIPIYAVRILNRPDCCTTRLNGSFVTIKNAAGTTLYTSSLIFDNTSSTTFENQSNTALSGYYMITFFPPNTQPNFT